MTKEPLLSVIMPVYNGEKRLSISIESVLNQDYRNIELILVNDGSKDNSRAILEYYAQQDSRVVVIHQENAGVSAARNRGVERAIGDYITFVDSDDTLEANAYKETVNMMILKGVDMAIFGMSYDYYRREFNVRNKELSANKDQIVSNAQMSDCFFHLYERSDLMSVCNKVIKASVIEDT
jgi:glycosyltransferase involved in cell wall biosynthesis